MTERIIKKYPNRRLYDTLIGSYITLDDVKKLVFEEIQFRVIDAKTKKDITKTTLLQIITEQENNGTPIFTTDLLQNFIRIYHEKSENMLSKYLEDTMSLFNQQKDYFQQQWQLYQQFLKDSLSFPSLIKEATLNLNKMTNMESILNKKKTDKNK